MSVGSVVVPMGDQSERRFVYILAPNTRERCVTAITGSRTTFPLPSAPYGELVFHEPANVVFNKQVTIVTKFNRLAVMVTHEKSWHSVSKNTSQMNRCCVSNYYFSKSPVSTDHEYFHVTSFRGRPEPRVRDSCCARMRC